MRSSVFYTSSEAGIDLGIVPRAQIVPSPEETRRSEITSYLSVALREAEGEQTLVDYSVFAPTLIAPGTTFVLDVWAYSPADREQVLRRAARQQRKVEVGSRGGLAMPLNVELVFRLTLDGFEVDRPLESFFWAREPANVSFLIRAPADLAAGVHAGQVEVFHHGMPIVRLLFEVTIGVVSTAAIPKDPQESRQGENRIRSAYASYSSKDRPIVVQRVQGISAVGVDVFLDVISLRAGQHWEEQLLRNIRECDTFYLFWSSNARESKYVEREWRFALDQRGLDFIHPIPLTDPRVAPPPDELADLHFRDIFLMFME